MTYPRKAAVRCLARSCLPRTRCNTMANPLASLLLNPRYHIPLQTCFSSQYSTFWSIQHSALVWGWAAADARGGGGAGVLDLEAAWPAMYFCLCCMLCHPACYIASLSPKVQLQPPDPGVLIQPNPRSVTPPASLQQHNQQPNPSSPTPAA